jgi:hypothetical protein
MRFLHVASQALSLIQETNHADTAPNGPGCSKPIAPKTISLPQWAGAAAVFFSLNKIVQYFLSSRVVYPLDNLNNSSRNDDCIISKSKIHGRPINLARCVI